MLKALASYALSTSGSTVLSWLATLAIRLMLMILTRTASKVWDLFPEGTIRCGLYRIRVSKRQQYVSIRKLKRRPKGVLGFSFTATTPRETAPPPPAALFSDDPRGNAFKP